MKDCPSLKKWKYDSDPEHARWFHPEVSPGSKKPHLCCKFAWTAWYDRKGLAYTQQATAERCFSETRPVEDACCRIGEEEQVAVRLKQFKTRAFQRTCSGYCSIDYGKSLPYFSVDDIASATDYDGSTLSVQQVKELLEYKKQAGAFGDFYHRQQSGEQVYTCSKHVNALIADQEDCRIRTKDPTECCCLQATVVPAQRCFPATGASTVGPLWVNGSYAEQKTEEGNLEGKISWPETPEELEKDLPDLLRSPDPETADGLEYDWSRATAQWNTTCLANQKVAWESVENRTRTIHHRMGTMTRTTRRTYQHYQQEWKTECISKEFNRICPEGQGLYVKQFPLGTCTKVPGPTNSDQLQLVGLGSGVMFQCPDGYQSGTEGALKSDAHCHCDGC
eukprot:Skav215851  [mRNA]  locus=scaffold1630:188974:190149:- [translate_table: standard]